MNKTKQNCHSVWQGEAGGGGVRRYRDNRDGLSDGDIVWRPRGSVTPLVYRYTSGIIQDHSIIQIWIVNPKS
jgi:hypothetical protein